MPILQNAKKALISSRKKTVFNSRVKSILKTMVDKIKKDPSEGNLSGAFSSIDKAVKRKLMHKNKAGRMKSQLSKLISVDGDSKPKTEKKVAVKKTAKKAPKKVVKKTVKKTKASTGKK